MSGACEYKSNYRKYKEAIEDHEKKSEKIETEILRLAGIAMVMIFVAWLHILQPKGLEDIVLFSTVIVCGYPLYRESLSSLKKGRVNMELSMVIAIIASLILLQFLPAIVITFFALLSEFIEGFIIKKGRKNIDGLYRHTPRKAIVKMQNNHENEQENLTTQEIPISEVIVGDIIIVREGDIIPIDGHIMKGSSTIDQSSITGESIPAEKNVGDWVFAGTINLASQLEIKCEKLSVDTTFAKIIHLVEETEIFKAPIQKLSDRLATRLVQFSIGLSALTFIITQNIISSLSVIVVAGACGIAVGTPIALLATNSKLAKKGIVVKGGLQIENIKNTGTIVFDKTGTLTVGKPTVSQVISFYQDLEPIKVLEYAAIAEKNVNHHLANAIEKRAMEEHIEVNLNQNHHRLTDNQGNGQVKVGGGVTITTQDGHRISIGNKKYMKEQLSTMEDGDKFPYSNSNSKFLHSPELQYHIYLLNRYNQEPAFHRDRIIQQITKSSVEDNIHDNIMSSSTTAFVSLDGKVIGCILLEDKLRKEAKQALAKIKSMGVNLVMLTGDNENIAKRIADEVGIGKFYSNLLPHEKVSKIEEIAERQKTERKGKTVIMVGDGINDAPALAKADVGIAMGKTGTDIAIEIADVVLMTEDLDKVHYILRTSKQSLSVIQQNFLGTLFIDGLGFILAFVGVINPLLAAMIHIGSELIFIANAARLIVDN
jgi:P-type Cu+ transporter